MNSKSDKISVIIPTFNRSHLIKRCINSLLSQTLEPDEIIIVDDGSTDDTRTVVERNFPKIGYYYQENKGISCARNLGIRMAKYEWLAFLDSDDEWLPLKLQNQMQAISNNHDMKICYTDEIWIRKGIRVNQKKRHAKYGGYIFKHCLPLCIISPSSVIIHRSILNEAGLFDETLPVCEDYDLWLRICSKYPVLYLNEPLIIKYGGHADQLSRKYWGMDRFRIHALEKIIKSEYLDRDNRIAANKMLLKKLEIILQGTRKRHKTNELAILEKKRAVYRNLLRNNTDSNRIRNIHFNN
jgi:glycosyltransferase involved in cell wall biosynthesis